MHAKILSSMVATNTSFAALIRRPETINSVVSKLYAKSLARPAMAGP